MVSDYRCEVLEHTSCGHNLKILRLRSLDTAFSCKAGQFVMLDLPTQAFFFRRPFSILSTESDGTFDIYYKVVGKGTKMMAEIQPGQQILNLGPLGTHFTPPENPRKALFIGGGIGIAPLYFMGKELQHEGQAMPNCFYGVRSHEEIGLYGQLMQVFGKNHLHISTDDGSHGFHGNICQLLETVPETVQTAETAYICGPTPMMAAAVKLLNKMNPALRIEVSLEEHMPCGTGACTGCVVQRTDQDLPSKVCVEGPVFPASQILWPGETKSQKKPAAKTRTVRNRNTAPC